MNALVQPISGHEPSCLVGKPVDASLSVGTFARTVDGVVFIFEVCGKDGYWVVRTQDDVEVYYRHGELYEWSPMQGEFVVEADNEKCPAGLVVETNGNTSLVKWPGFVRPQSWANADLEPGWID